MFRRQPRTTKRNWKLIVVSHTHWDREWYMPYQRFRAMLVEAVDSLLSIMAADPSYRHFTLDGQTIILEDYLEVRPEKEGELRDLVSQGRILIGPWYVMPDEFLVSGESLIRNLLEGRRTGGRFGPVMPVGYIPDPFGHIAQMPQLLRGFGIDSAILWRGIGGVRQNELMWEALDGSKVLLARLPGGYSNASVLPSAPDSLMERIADLRSRLEPGATSDYLLLMNGDDHMFPQPDTPTLIAQANRRLKDAELIHGTLPMMIEGIRANGRESPGHQEWETVAGEFRSSEFSHLLAGVLSTRMNIKQRNAQSQLLLERWAEPFSIYAALLAGGGSTRIPMSIVEAQGLLRLAWRYLLKNQPHDSICGCSIDQVHDEMGVRYDWCQQVAESVAHKSLEQIAEAANTESVLKDASEAGALVIFNSEPGPRTDWVTATVQMPADPDQAVLTDAAGEAVPYQLLSRFHTELASASLSRQEIQGYLRLSGPGKDWPRWKLKILEKILRAALRDRMPDLAIARMEVLPGADPSTVEVDVEAAAGREHNYDALSAGLRQLSALVDRGDAQHFRLRVRRSDQAEVGLVAKDVPSFGMKLFHFSKAARTAVIPPDEHEEPTLENQYLSLQVSPEDGSVRLLDLETGSIYWGINSFVDGGDAGDEYTYSPPPRDHVVRGPAERPSISWEERGPARHRLRVDMSLRLPARLTDDRQARSSETVSCPVTTWLSIYPGVPRLDIRTQVTNLAMDHRLRVHFPTRLTTGFSFADGQFAVIRRPLRPEAHGDGWMEHPVTSGPQLEWVDISDGESGLMIANRGLPEYDVAVEEEGESIALTLLRCVGWLSRDDLTTRRGAAGPSIPTPGAQMQGTCTFDYSVIPHAGGWEQGISQARWFARELRARWTGRHPGPLGVNASFLDISPASLALSAVKPDEGGRGEIVVRLYNLAGHPVEGSLSSHFPLASAVICNLAEEDEGEIELLDPHRLPVRAGPHQIVTLRLRPDIEAS